MAHGDVTTKRESRKLKLMPEDVSARVEVQIDITDGLHERQDTDLDLYRGEEFDANEDESTEYASYTSNEPQTYSNKIMSLLSTGKMVPRIPHLGAKETDRRKYDKKERLVRGFFAAADLRLVAMLEPVLLDQLAFYVPIRGWYAVRALLLNVEEVNGVESTEVDITPFDPRHVYWGMGPKGVEWACNKTWLTPGEIWQWWGVEVEGAENEPLEVYDYYDNKFNTVVTRLEAIKKPTEHGYWKVPVAIGMVGITPRLKSEDKNEADWAAYGESVFYQNRSIYKNKNLILSIYLHLLLKNRDPAYTFKTPGAEGELEDDPNDPGRTHRLDTEDKLDMVEIPEVTKTVEQMFAITSGEGQRGGLPYSVFGELAFQLSGFAINSLNTTLQTTIHPFQSTIERAYDQVANMLVDQYTSRRFDTMQVSGFEGTGKYFQEEIEIEDVKDLPPVTWRLTANIAQDQAGKYALAEAAVQFLSMPDILEQILEVDDVDATMDAFNAQMAQQNDAMAAAYTMMIGAERRGDKNIAAIWWAKIQFMMNQMLQAGVEPASPTTGAPKPGQLDPRLISQPQQNGGQPPIPTPQSGPNQPEGQPRPGAQGQPGPGILQRLIGAVRNNGQ